MNSESLGSTGVKVSVVMITYNHEHFIAQAIDGVLMQQTDFAVELVIGEDCSTDGTRAVVRDYADRYPGRIRPLLHAHNVGGQANFIATLNECRGQYIALCDGDDYWTDPHKLQKQVKYLEAHPECAFCLHDVRVIFQDGSRPSYRFRPPGHKSQYVLEDVLESTLSQTASLVFRGHLLPGFPDWFSQVPLGDWALNVLLAEHGSIGYLDECMSVWRNHAGGVWNGIAERNRLRQQLLLYDLFDAHFGYRYTATLDQCRAVRYYALALDCWLNGQRTDQAQWMHLVVDKFPDVSEALFTKVLYSTLAVQPLYGFQRAEDALNWTCDEIGVLPAGAAWCHKLRGAWYASAAFKAFAADDRAAAYAASCRAVRYDWRILGNLGFMKRWASVIIEGLRSPESLQVPGTALHSSEDER